MLPHHVRLEEFLRTKSKTALIQWVSDLYQQSTADKAWSTFKEFIYEILFLDLDEAWLLETIDTFYKDTICGKYYESTPIDRPFDVPLSTEIWCDEIGCLLDLCCEMFHRDQPDTARRGLERLLDLLDDKVMEDDIIDAPEFCDWMIICRHDYRKIYNELQE